MALQLRSEFCAMARHWRVVASIGSALLLQGCGAPSLGLDCAGSGQVSGGYREANSGNLEFKRGLFWGDSGLGYKVLFTDDPLLAEALRASPDPAREAPIAADMLHVLLVGYDFHPDGKYRQHFTWGTGKSSGWSGADVGHVDIDDQGCARGDVRLDSPGSGHFALPLLHPERLEVASKTAVEVETGVRRQRPALTAGAAVVDDDPLARWRLAFARLNDPHPANALRSVGFSAAVAAQLSAHPKALKALERMRGQCPQPATAKLNEYGEVVGESRPKSAASRSQVVLSGTATATVGADGAFIDNCYVMQRDGQWIDQCWPLSADCTATPLYDPDK